jgi:hypothetical protein
MFPHAKPSVNAKLGKCEDMKLKKERTQCLADAFNLTLSSNTIMNNNSSNIPVTGLDK